MVEGKAGYMSPEQARGEPLDPRADVFAAGIILWELVSGRKLYKARPNENLLDVAKRAVVPELPRRGMALEEELFVIVRRALARDRTSRYASAGAMLRDLESYAARSGMVASTLRLRRFLTEHFEPDVLAARSRRELATLALAKGPLVVLDVVPALMKDGVKSAPLVTTEASERPDQRGQRVEECSGLGAEQQRSCGDGADAFPGEQRAHAGLAGVRRDGRRGPRVDDDARLSPARLTRRGTRAGPRRPSLRWSGLCRPCRCAGPIR